MTTLLWIDVETDGLDPERDHLLEVGLLATGSDLEPLDGGVFSPIRFDGPVDAFIGRMHGPTACWRNAGRRRRRTKEVAGWCRAYVARHLARSADMLVAGSSVSFDRRWLDRHMPGLLDGLGHRSLDVSAVDEASRLWAPDVRGARPDRTTDHRVRHCLADSIALARHYKEALWDRSQG